METQRANSKHAVEFFEISHIISSCSREHHAMFWVADGYPMRVQLAMRNESQQAGVITLGAIHYYYYYQYLYDIHKFIRKQNELTKHNNAAQNWSSDFTENQSEIIPEKLGSN